LISGAFDSVWHKGLIAKLKSLGIEGQLLQLLSDYLSNRSLSVVLQGSESRSYPIEAGVPQGSLFGPLMWNIYFDDLLHLIPEAIAYADDLTIHISYAKEHTQENSERLQWIIELATKWGKLWKVQFAATKSQSLTISRRSESESDSPLHGRTSTKRGRLSTFSGSNSITN